MKYLIIYQHRSREYDNALLLKVALESDGNFVDIKHDASDLVLFNRYDFYIFPCLYNDDQLKFLEFRFNIFSKPILNLRYEQVCTKFDLESGLMVPEGKAKDIPLISWGNLDKKYLINHGVSPENVFVTGHITMDYLRDEFRPFWKSRKEISQEYNIPLEKKWMLFISTLSYAEDSEGLDKGIRFYGENKELRQVGDIHSNTRIILLDWFEGLLFQKDVCIIYRPHPSERAECETLNKVKNRYEGRFFVVNEENIKQWILVSDIIATWMSTSIVECYFAKKNCIILRPSEIDIPEGWDAMMYEGATCIKNKKAFLDYMNSALQDFMFQSHFPINEDKLLKNYSVDSCPSFYRIIKVIHDTNIFRAIDITERKWNIQRVKYLVKYHTIIKILIKNIYCFLYTRFGFRIKTERIRSRFALEIWEINAKAKQNCEIDKKKIKELSLIVNKLHEKMEEM